MNKHQVAILLFLASILFIVSGGYQLISCIFYFVSMNLPIIFIATIRPMVTLIVGIVLLFVSIMMKEENKRALTHFITRNKKTILVIVSLLAQAAEPIFLTGKPSISVGNKTFPFSP
jgi:hypothetical protein